MNYNVIYTSDPSKVQQPAASRPTPTEPVTPSKNDPVKVAVLTEQVRQLQDELARLKAMQVQHVPPPAPKPADSPAKPAKPEDEDAALEAKTSDAAVQQLRRLCQPRADGSLKVPPEVKQAFENGGAERAKYLKLLASCNYKKDCTQELLG